MKKQTFTFIIIVVIALFLSLVEYFNLINKTYIIYPSILAFYYIGQYSERKFKD